MSLGYLIGADPELFVQNEAGVFINGHGLIPGTKEEPFKVKNGGVQVDGMALEFNIDPASNREEFEANVASVLQQLDAMIVKAGRVVAAPVARFDPAYFKTQPAESKEMGCDPDYNAWAMEINSPPNGDQPFRTAAGHIHIGWTSGADVFDMDHFELCAAIIRHLDTVVGPWTVVQDPGSHERRSLYGRAGAFRPKPYGVEWRVPSNFWVQGRAGEMYDQVMGAMKMWDAGDQRVDESVIDIINESNVEAAKEMLNA